MPAHRPTKIYAPDAKRRAPRLLVLMTAAMAGSLLASGAHATLITTGNVSPGTLATNPETTSQIVVGFSGNGSLEINASAAGNGVTAVTGNFSGSVSAVAGFGSGSTGTITVTGDGTAGSASLTGSRSLQFGTSGGSGFLSVQNGGLVQTLAAGDGVTLGNSSSTGTATVQGAGSVLSSAGRINVGSFTGASGSLTITDGGLVQTTGNGGLLGTADIAIGADENSFGEVTVSGAGSRLATNGALVGNGSDSHASLTIQNGGVMTTTANAAGGGGGISVGTLNGATVTVTGTGSKLEVGANTSDDNFLAGKEVVIGGFGTGTLLVDQSGTVDATGANILVGGGLFGTQTAPGTLTVREGAAVTANSVTVNQGGVLDGAGGTINGNVTLNGGTLAPGNSPGAMTIDGDLTLLTGILKLEVAASAADLLDVSGNVLLGGDLIISLIFLDPPGPGAEIDIASFFAGYQDFGVDPAFDLASHIELTGLAADDRLTVRLAGDSVILSPPPAAVPEPTALALLSAGLGILALTRRRRT